MICTSRHHPTPVRTCSCWPQVGGVGAYEILVLVAVSLLAVESPSFLLDKGRGAEAASAIRRIAAFNGVQPSAQMEGSLEALETRSGSSSSGSMVTRSQRAEVGAAEMVGGEVAEMPAEGRGGEGALAALFAPERRLPTAAISLGFIACTLNWYALGSEADALSFPILLNLCLLAAVDVPGYTLAAWLVDAKPFGIGVRGATAGTLAAGGVLSLLIALNAASTADSAAHQGALFVTLLALGAKLLFATPFQLIYLLPIEYYPARFRATAIGFSLSLGRLASTASPYIAGTLPLELVGAIFAASAFLAAAALGAMPSPIPVGKAARRVPKTDCHIEVTGARTSAPQDWL